jgi:hypothetical protein
VKFGPKHFVCESARAEAKGARVKSSIWPQPEHGVLFSILPRHGLSSLGVQGCVLGAWRAGQSPGELS